MCYTKSQFLSKSTLTLTDPLSWDNIDGDRLSLCIRGTTNDACDPVKIEEGDWK